MIDFNYYKNKVLLYGWCIKTWTLAWTCLWSVQVDPLGGRHTVYHICFKQVVVHSGNINIFT